MQVTNIKMYFNFLVAVLSFLFSAQRSKSFFKLIDGFYHLDTFVLNIKRLTNLKTQNIYLLYALSIEVYYLIISVYYSEMNVTILFILVLVSASIMLMITQYVAFVTIIRQRYTLANYIFSSSKHLKRSM